MPAGALYLAAAEQAERSGHLAEAARARRSVAEMAAEIDALSAARQQELGELRTVTHFALETRVSNVAVGQWMKNVRRPQLEGAMLIAARWGDEIYDSLGMDPVYPLDRVELRLLAAFRRLPADLRERLLAEAEQVAAQASAAHACRRPGCRLGTRCG